MQFLKRNCIMRGIANEAFHLARPCSRRRASIRRCIRLAKLHSIYTVIISRMPLMPSHAPDAFFSSLSRSLDLSVSAGLSPSADEKAVGRGRYVPACITS